MSEQLNLDLLQASASDNPTAELADFNNDEYEALDYQLAQLLQQQNGKINQTLKEHTLAISKHTREGQIFIPCSADDKAELLNTHIVGVTGDYKPLILDNDYLYLNRYFSYQQQLADNISKRRLISDKPIPEWLEKRLTHYFAEDTKQQSEGDLKENGSINWQQKAAELTLKQPFLVLSGGPGTGKTTTVSRILALLLEQHAEAQQQDETTAKGLRILLAAPTGKAAIRLLDSLQDVQGKLGISEQLRAKMPQQASTLHKLLGFQLNSTQFKHHQNNPLPADVVIIDEASMIDIAMMAKLLDAIPTQATLILVGDKDQLSSVEIGSVFNDICNGLAGSNHLISLQKNWRFSQHSGIGKLAKAVNNSEADLALEIIVNDDQTDCSLLPPTSIDPPKIPKSLIEPWQHYFEVLNQPNSTVDEIFNAFNEYRILCALRRGLNGSQLLSDRIETEIAKLGMLKNIKSVSQNTASWYHGRPVMITQNSYSKGLFNGDTGIALKMNNQLKVYFPDNSKTIDNQEKRYKSFAPIRLPAHETTWAMTIHKSQGSEFNQVTLVLPHEVMPLLTKQLIYTGITRAKKKVTIIASDEILKAGIMTEAITATRIVEKINL